MTTGQQEDLCPICRSYPHDAFVTSCGHVFCGPCICDHLVRSSSGAQGRVTCQCPTCRQQLQKCWSTSDCTGGDSSARLVSFKLGKVVLQVDVDMRQPRSRLQKLLQAHPDSIKYVYKGKILKNDHGISSAVASSRAAVITLLTSRTQPRHAMPILVFQFLFTLLHSIFTGNALQFFWKIRNSLLPFFVAVGFKFEAAWLMICLFFGSMLNPSHARRSAHQRRSSDVQHQE